MCAATVRSRRIPKLRFCNGRGFVEIGKRRHYLGAADDPATRRAYARMIAESHVSASAPPVDTPDLTVAELCAAYIIHAREYYKHPNGEPTGEHVQFERAIKIWDALYGDTNAADFRPKALKTVRLKMVEAGWSRGYVNAQIGRIRRIVRWAVENELVPAAVFEGVRAVTPLKRGRGEDGRDAVRDCEPVEPVAEQHVAAVIPHLPRPVAAMVKLQLLCGCRPGELLGLKPTDLKTDGKVWTATLAAHKNAYRGQARTLYFGPQAQAILREFLHGRSIDKPIFQPSESVSELHERRRRERTTAESHGNSPGTNRVRRPHRTAGERYSIHSYGRAITRACMAAFPLPSHLARLRGQGKHGGLEKPKDWRARLTAAGQWKDVAAWIAEHHFSPHQLRHTAATRLASERGWDVARLVMGHRTVSATRIYVEDDHAKVVAVMSAVG